MADDAGHEPDSDTASDMIPDTPATADTPPRNAQVQRKWRAHHYPAHINRGAEDSIQSFTPAQRERPDAPRSAVATPAPGQRAARRGTDPRQDGRASHDTVFSLGLALTF